VAHCVHAEAPGDPMRDGRDGSSSARSSRLDGREQITPRNVNPAAAMVSNWRPRATSVRRRPRLREDS
jgi:hypothetical protein